MKTLIAPRASPAATKTRFVKAISTNSFLNPSDENPYCTPGLPRYDKNRVGESQPAHLYRLAPSRSKDSTHLNPQAQKSRTKIKPLEPFRLN